MLQKIASTHECSSATTTFNATLKWFLLSRRGQVRDPRHQRGAKRLQDGHLQQDQERHEACRQVERNTNNNNDNLSVPSPRLSEVTEKVAFSIVFNDDCNMPPVDLASHSFISHGTRTCIKRKKLPMVNFSIFVQKNVSTIRFQEIKIRPLKGFEKMRFLCFYIIGV